MKDQVNEAIANFISSAQGMEITTTLCECGAVTMSAYESSEQITFLATNAPYIGFTLNETCGCNRCHNGWAIDKINNDQKIEELEAELDELEELDSHTVKQSGRRSWLDQEISRLEMEAQES